MLERLHKPASTAVAAVPVESPSSAVNERSSSGMLEARARTILRCVARSLGATMSTNERGIATTISCGADTCAGVASHTTS